MSRGVDCAVCAEQILPADGVISQQMPDGPHPDADPVPCSNVEREDMYWVHIACTKDGVERWCRGGRPGRSPLAWIRENGLNWTGLGGHGTRGQMVLTGPGRG